MKYSYNWLKEISKVDITSEKMADALMMHSFEVESIEKKGEGLENVVVGKILEIEKHPNADRLQVTKIDIGTEFLQIVCGASNIKIGDKVPVALVGAILPGKLEIKEAEIRGVKSFGMLCAQDELGLGKDHNGILILDQNLKIGKKISKALDIDDVIFEIKVLPDRGHDALCHLGMAREVAALNNKKIETKRDLSRIFPKIGKLTFKKLKVEIKDKKLCPRYVGAILENVKVESSPNWLKNRLLSLGVNPINNIVDATNYVMLELGQPLHAFDLKQLTADGKQQTKVIVRRAQNGEEIKLLDGTVKKLSNDDLVIASENKILALAGIMGGEDSGISENTTSIILESANFNAVNIRKSRTRLNLKTEASDRYEKEIDPNLCEMAMARVIEIIKSYGANVDGITDNYPDKIKPWSIKVNLDYVNNLLGEKIPEKEAKKILELLGIKVTKSPRRYVTCVIPTIRIDLKTQEDLIEEIGRIFGYEKIKSQAPLYEVRPSKINEERQFERTLKDYLASSGFSEVYNYSFYSEQDAKKAGFSQKHFELENPMNPEQALMRISLVPQILKNIKENTKYFKEIEIFEIGRVYFAEKETLPLEKNMLVGATSLEEKTKGENFYEAKGQVDLILEKLGINDYYFDEFKNKEENIHLIWHRTRFAQIKTEGNEEILGQIGEINPVVLERFGIEKKVAMFEIDMKKLREISGREREFKPLRKFPTSIRDISMTSEKEVRVDDILLVIQGSGGSLVIDVDLFDIYDLPEEKTSYAFRIVFGLDERTLRNEEVDEAMDKIVTALEKELKMKVRK